MTPTEAKTVIATIQGLVGVKPDGIWGTKSQAAMDALLNSVNMPAPSPVAPPAGLKLCIDAGHGMSNRTPGTYDPGALGVGHAEASIALEYALALADACKAAGIQFWLTRTNATDSTPVGIRASRAKAQGCTHLVSIHLNAFDSPSAKGTETLYRDSSTLSNKIQDGLLRALKLTDRGTKRRTDLAVLKFSGPCALIELGFITNAGDLAAILAPGAKEKVAAEIVKALA